MSHKTWPPDQLLLRLAEDAWPEVNGLTTIRLIPHPPVREFSSVVENGKVQAVAQDVGGFKMAYAYDQDVIYIAWWDYEEWERLGRPIYVWAGRWEVE